MNNSIILANYLNQLRDAGTPIVSAGRGAAVCPHRADDADDADDDSGIVAIDGAGDGAVVAVGVDDYWGDGFFDSTHAFGGAGFVWVVE